MENKSGKTCLCPGSFFVRHQSSAKSGTSYLPVDARWQDADTTVYWWTRIIRFFSIIPEFNSDFSLCKSLEQHVVLLVLMGVSKSRWPYWSPYWSNGSLSQQLENGQPRLRAAQWGFMKTIHFKYANKYYPMTSVNLIQRRLKLTALQRVALFPNSFYHVGALKL